MLIKSYKIHSVSNEIVSNNVHTQFKFKKKKDTIYSIFMFYVPTSLSHTFVIISFIYNNIKTINKNCNKE